MTLIDYNPWGQSQKEGGAGAGAVMKSPPAERLGGPSSKLTSRMSDRFDRTKEKTKEKTKEAAKKVKTGASTGVHWVKIKCNQANLFPKK